MFSYLDHLPYYHLLVRLRASQTAYVNTFLGQAVRGALVSSALQMVCPQENANQTGRPACNICPDRESCLYISTFEPLAPQNRIATSGTAKTPPRPYLVKCRMRENEFIESGETIEFELVLLSSAGGSIPLVYKALEGITLGPVGREVHFPLQELICKPSGRELYKQGLFSNELQVAVVDTPNSNSRRLRISYLSPYITKKYDPEHNCLKTQSIAGFSEFLSFLDRRVSNLARIWGEDGVQVPERVDKKGAEGVYPVPGSKKDEPYTGKHFSRRGGHSKVLGYTGEIEYEGDWSPWARLISAGEVFHFGEDTTKGYGWYSFTG
jgi:hypothetical protein